MKFYSECTGHDRFASTRTTARNITLGFLAFLFAGAIPGLAQQNVYGCPVQPSNSVFYARIDSLPTLAQSATYTANMTTAGLTWDSGFGVSASTSMAPTINAQFFYTPAYNGVWRYPAFYNVDRQAGSLGGNFPADHHTIVVDTDTCNIWETYHAYVNPADGTIETGNMCNNKPCNAQSGWQYNGTSTALPTQGTTDAAGLPLLPLIWRAHEILDGVIQHPTRFTLTRPYIQAGHPQWPASGTNGYGGANNPPYGTRFRLKASVTINLTGLSAQQQVYANTIITALQRYGLVLADVGTNMNAVVDDEAGQEPDIMAALNKVAGQIKAAQLEAVDLSSLQPSPASYAVANSLPTSNNTVGTPYTYLNVQAGTSIQLASWVNGPAAGSGVTWQVASGNIGSITTDGIYTPPATVAGLVRGVLLATSQADSTATSTVYVRILPAGAIRIAAGIQNGTITDRLKQVWQPNVFFRGGDTYFGSSYPNWPAPSDPTQAAEMGVYQTYAHTYGNDFVTSLVVPNGSYNLRVMFGQPAGANGSNCPFPAVWHNHVGVEVQNQVVVPDFDFGASINYACTTPVDLNVTATVTNNVLEFALRNMVPDGASQTTTPQFSGIEIIQTSASQ